MKINMTIRYLKIEDLTKTDKEPLQQVWCVLKDLGETLDIRYPKNSISVSLYLENCKISSAKVYEILEEFQEKKILKILKTKKLNKDLSSVSVNVNKKKFNSEYKEIKDRMEKLNLLKSQEETRIKTNLLITRNKKNGDFYYKNKLIKLENKEAIYYLIFECLYEKGDLNGFCSHETINKYLEEHGKEELTDDRCIKDRIKNGVENLFRFSNLPRKAPDGKKSIQKIRGNGVSLYNPPA